MTVGMIGGKFLPLHLGHVYAITKASSHVDKLYVVLSSSEIRDQELCKKSNIKYMDNKLRMAWLGEVFALHENITLMNRVDEYTDENYDWGLESEEIKKIIPEAITHVFSSEEHYEEYFNKGFPDAKHIIIDNRRTIIPISATAIRKDPIANWEFLPRPVQKYFTKKVCIVGTESAGKSTLVKKLANVFNTDYVHEIGVDYCLKYKNELTETMFDSISMKHYLAQEEALGNSNKVLFVDSDAVITQYYANMYLEYNSDLVNEIIKKQEYDLVLYLEPDVKWVDDGLRFAGEQEVRERNNKALKEDYSTKVLNQCLAYIDRENRNTPAGYTDLQIPLTFGKYKGKTLETLLEEDIYYTNWVYKNNVVELSNESKCKIKKVMKTQHNRNKRHFGKRTRCDWSGGAAWMQRY